MAIFTSSTSTEPITGHLIPSGPWEHNVVVEEISAAAPDVDLLDALVDPTHPHHEELREGLPLDFDSAHFDLSEATIAMRSRRPLEGW